MTPPDSPAHQCLKDDTKCGVLTRRRLATLGRGSTGKVRVISERIEEIAWPKMCQAWRRRDWCPKRIKPDSPKTTAPTPQPLASR